MISFGDYITGALVPTFVTGGNTEFQLEVNNRFFKKPCFSHPSLQTFLSSLHGPRNSWIKKLFFFLGCQEMALHWETKGPDPHPGSSSNQLKDSFL